MLPYRSPYHIIHYFGPFDPAEDPELKRLQKKFLAEFNVLQQPFLKIGGMEYSRQDVIRIIEELRALPADNIHRRLFEKPALLLFFESPGAALPEEELSRLLAEEREDGTFQTLVAGVLHERLRSCLPRHDYGPARSYALASELGPVAQERVYEGIEQQILNLAYLLREWPRRFLASAQLEAAFPRELGFLLSHDFVDFLDELPLRFTEAEQLLYKTLFYFLDFCYRNYKLPPAFYYTLIDHLLDLQGIGEDLRPVFYDFKNRIVKQEVEERAMMRQIVREPGDQAVPLTVWGSPEMSEERKALIRRKLSYEQRFATATKALIISSIALVFLGGLFFTMPGISLLLLWLALAAFILFAAVGIAWSLMKRHHKV